MSKYCPQCKQTKNQEEYSKHARRSDGLQSICKACKQQLDRTYYQDHKWQKIAYNKQVRRAAVAWLEEVKVCHGCCCCQETEGCCLQFHHVRGTKDADISVKAGNWSRAKIVEELRKCVVVCANCHIKIHRGLQKLPRDVNPIIVEA